MSLNLINYFYECKDKYGTKVEFICRWLQLVLNPKGYQNHFQYQLNWIIARIALIVNQLEDLYLKKKKLKNSENTEIPQIEQNTTC